ncbi:MAG: MFS transporter [Deltaproteobacteria bacterium]|nr:MFS transporter [Deltaproteobacteria bacterium]
MGWMDLFRVARPEVAALHKTWTAFFLTFFVWFNMAPLATTIARAASLTEAQLKLLAICNVALTVPARIFIGMASDRFGPRRTFAMLMILSAIPCLAFAIGSSYTQLLISRLVLSSVGAGFVIGIHMTSLWFKPKDIGFAEGVEAGLGNWGSSIAAMTLPSLALGLFGGANGWRYSIALSAVVMALYGVYYWFGITDGPAESAHRRPRKAAAIEVSSWGDLGSAILWTVPIMGVLAILVWRVSGMGFMGTKAALVAYGVIAVGVVYQMVQLLRVNVPILRKGVPADDRYRFTDVACLCSTYVANFGAELAVVSMLPAFFEKTFHMSPQWAGLIGAQFAFLNFFSRALGGYVSDRMTSRRKNLLVYMAGIAASFVLMGFINSAWPVALAVFATWICAMFVTGGCGATFAMIPLVKRRITGQVAGYAGAWGNVGATVFLTVYTFVSDSQFFFVLGGTALVSFVFCVLSLKEPKGAFAETYQLSSVDREIELGQAA